MHCINSQIVYDFICRNNEIVQRTNRSKGAAYPKTMTITHTKIL